MELLQRSQWIVENLPRGYFRKVPKPSCSIVQDPENSDDFADVSFDDSDLDPDYRLTSEKTEKPSTDDETPQASSARRKGSKLLQRKAIKSARVAGVSYTNTSNKKSEKKYF